MQTVWLTVMAIASALIHLRAEYLGPDWQIYVFKPLTLVFVLLIAVRAEAPASIRYKRLITLGLGLSLVGDVLLMLPVDLFLPGLIVFLMAHVVYLTAFWVESPRGRGPGWAPIPYVLYAVLVYSLLIPGLEEMTIPVFVYVIIINWMGWFALRRWWMLRQPAAGMAAVGALFFMFSDTVLALNRFLQPFEAATALVLVSYYVAQWLLARSADSGTGLRKGKTQ